MNRALLFEWHKRFKEGRESVRDDDRCGRSNKVNTPELIWPRWASRQLLIIPIVQSLIPVPFGYSLSSEAVVMRQLRRWKRLWQRSLTRSHKRTSMGPSWSCWNGRTSALPPEEITWKCVLSINVPIRKKSGNLSYAPRILWYCFLSDSILGYPILTPR